jgi:4-amino-4-deoxy-L-arabinose transferase-like glycosyltransferase
MAQQLLASTGRHDHPLLRALTLGAVLLAWLLGCGQLAAQSMWVDEWFTNYNIGQTWADFLPSIISTERRPPLHFAALKLWRLLAGPEEFALRLYSVGMVVLAVALLFALGRRLLNARAGALAACLLAVSPFWLLYGRMIRAYSQTMMLALAATLLLVVAVDRGRLWWLVYAMAAAALIYTDYSGLPILAAHGIFVIATAATVSPRRWPPVGFWLAAMAVTAVLYLPWVPSILVATARGVRVTDLAGGPLGFAVKAGVPLYVWAVGETVYPWHPLGAAAALAVGLTALWGLWRTWRRRPAAGWLLGAWIGLPLLFTATLLSVVATDITFLNAASRTPGAAPAYLLAAAAGLVALRRSWLRAAALACIAGGMLVSGLNYFAGVQYLNPIYALPTRAVAAELAAAAQPGDLILAERDTLFGHYYGLTPGAATYQDVDPPANLAWIDQHHPATIWLVTFGRDSTEGAFGTPELLAQLQTRYTPGAGRGYGLVEPSYQALKQRLTGRPAYAQKLMIQPFTRP